MREARERENDSVGGIGIGISITCRATCPVMACRIVCMNPVIVLCILCAVALASPVSMPGVTEERRGYKRTSKRRSQVSEERRG